MPHYNTQIVAVLGMARPPNVLEQLLLGYHATDMPRQLRQYRVLLSRQADLDAIEADSAVGKVHL